MKPASHLDLFNLNFFKERSHIPILLLILFIGFALRYLNLDYGLPYLYHWDEPQTASTALRILKTGDLNPHFFNYGSLTIYLNFIVDIFYFLSQTAKGVISSLNEIKINFDTGWHWTISHPDFYFFNRLLTSFFAIGTVFLVYALTRDIYGKWIGIIASFVLGTLPVHIQHSSWVTTDVPMAFFVVATLYFSVRYIKFENKNLYFYLSLISVGLGMSTKYNASLSIFIPLLSFFIVKFSKDKPLNPNYLLAYLAIIPSVTFIIVMPYSILDFSTFFSHVIAEVRHYKILGHGVHSSEPGFEHLLFQLKKFHENFGLVNLLVALLGLYSVYKRPIGLLILFFPVLYIYYMTGMRVNFHRNFIVIYPFLAIFFALGVSEIYSFAKKINKQKKIIKKFYLLTATSLLVILMVLPNLTSNEVAVNK